MLGQWEIRRALRWGSEHIGFVSSRTKAVAHAIADIKENGNEGRIDYIDKGKKIVYYDIHPELT